MIDNKTLIIGGLVIAILIGVVAVFLASSDPDGMESTALIIQGQKSLIGPTPPDAEIQENLEGKFAYSAPMPDYSLGEGIGFYGWNSCNCGRDDSGISSCNWPDICLKGSRQEKSTKCKSIDLFSRT